MDAEAKNFEGLKGAKQNYSQRLKLDLGRIKESRQTSRKDRGILADLRFCG
jgi:hypothetical protein